MQRVISRCLLHVNKLYILLVFSFNAKMDLAPCVALQQAIQVKLEYLQLLDCVAGVSLGRPSNEADQIQLNDQQDKAGPSSTAVVRDCRGHYRSNDLRKHRA